MNNPYIYELTVKYCMVCEGVITWGSKGGKEPLATKIEYNNTMKYGRCICNRCSICGDPCKEGLIDGDFCIVCWIEQ